MYIFKKVRDIDILSFGIHVSWSLICVNVFHWKQSMLSPFRKIATWWSENESIRGDYERSVASAIQRRRYTWCSAIGLYGCSIKYTFLHPKISCSIRCLARDDFARRSSSPKGSAKPFAICLKVEEYDISGKERRECFSRRWFPWSNDGKQPYWQLKRNLMLNHLYNP